MTEPSKAHQQAQALESALFHDITIENTPIFDHEQGEYTDEFPESNRSVESEARLTRFLKTHRFQLGANEHWRPYYRDMDRQAREQSKGL